VMTSDVYAGRATGNINWRKKKARRWEKMTRRGHVPRLRLDDRRDSVDGVGSELLAYKCTVGSCPRRLLLSRKCGDLTHLVEEDSTAYVHHAGYCEFGGEVAQETHGLVTLIYHQH
jgi:hypothetical protein